MHGDSLNAGGDCMQCSLKIYTYTPRNEVQNSAASLTMCDSKMDRHQPFPELSQTKK